MYLCTVYGCHHAFVEVTQRQQCLSYHVCCWGEAWIIRYLCCPQTLWHLLIWVIIKGKKMSFQSIFFYPCCIANTSVAKDFLLDSQQTLSLETKIIWGSTGIKLEFPLDAMEAGLPPYSGTHPGSYTSPIAQIFFHILKRQSKPRAFLLLSLHSSFHLLVPHQSLMFHLEFQLHSSLSACSRLIKTDPCITIRVNGIFSQAN